MLQNFFLQYISEHFVKKTKMAEKVSKFARRMRKTKIYRGKKICYFMVLLLSENSVFTEFVLQCRFAKS